MKVVFSLRNLWYVKHYATVFAEFAARGHDLVITTEPFEPVDPSWREAADRVAAASPRIRFVEIPERAADPWIELSRLLRRSLDYLRFLDRAYDDFPRLRERAAIDAPPPITRLTTLPGLGRGRLVRGILDVAERAVPISAALQAFLERERPDLVLLSPLVALGTTQLDVLRAARASGLRTVWAVGSWDHLTSKALIRDRPGHVFVWNARQREEATRLHGIAADRVVITGAQAFDHWFGWQPRPRAEFLARAGLPADRPYILYACSCLLAGSPLESEFVRVWARAIRASTNPRLREASLLVRPHPKRDDEFDRVPLDDIERVAVWPRGGVGPIVAESQADYFDSLYHAAAVVGLNTSAFIEAGIVGRPVHVILPERYRDNQEGTMHFRYLVEEAGGLVRPTRTMEAHLADLDAALAGTVESPRSAFLEAFVRPGGLAERATDVFVDAAERVAREPAPQAVRTGVGRRGVRLLLRPAARWAAARSPSAVRLDRQRRHEAKAQERQQAQAARREAEMAWKAERQRVRDEEKAERIREHRRMKDEARSKAR